MKEIISSTPTETHVRKTNLNLSFDLSDSLEVNEPISFKENATCNTTPKGTELFSIGLRAKF